MSAAKSQESRNRIDSNTTQGYSMIIDQIIRRIDYGIC